MCEENRRNLKSTVATPGKLPRKADESLHKRLAVVSPSRQRAWAHVTLARPTWHGTREKDKEAIMVRQHVAYIAMRIYVSARRFALHSLFRELLTRFYFTVHVRVCPRRHASNYIDV